MRASSNSTVESLPPLIDTITSSQLSKTKAKRWSAASRTLIARKFCVIVIDLGAVDDLALVDVGGHRPIFEAVAGVPVAEAPAAERLEDAVLLDDVEQLDIGRLIFGG